MKDTTGVSEKGFLDTLQALVKDLRRINLSWLPAVPLTGKKGKLGAGSWVSENWSSMVRLSPFVHGWCVKDHAKMQKRGVDDLSRVVIAPPLLCGALSCAFWHH